MFDFDLVDIDLKIFNSMGFSICSLIILIVVLISYLIKSKNKKMYLSNKYFILASISLFIASILEIIYVEKMGINLNSSKSILFARLFLLFITITIGFCYLYMLALRTKEISDVSKSKKIRSILSIIVFILIIVCSILVFNFSITMNETTDLYFIDGTVINFVHVFFLISMLLIIIALFIENQNIDNSNKIPLISSFSVILFLILLQAILDFHLNIETIELAIFLLAIYFTTENQDAELLRESLIKKNEMEIANKNQTDFISNIFYGIRMPMNVIMGLSDYLLSENEYSVESLKKDASSINKSSRMLSSLINNIIDYSKIESNEQTINDNDYYFSDLLYDINSYLSSVANKNSYVMKYDNKIPSIFYGDYDKVYRVIINLLNSLLECPDYIQIELDIKGQIIENNMFNLVFEMTTLGDIIDINGINNKEKKYDNTTFNMIISKKMIELLNGNVETVKVNNGKSKYIVNIKQKIKDLTVIGKVDYVNKYKPLNVLNKNILIVEDKMTNIIIITKLLNQYNINCDYVNNSDDCLKAIKLKKYDLLLLDYLLPEKNGETLLSELKSKYKDLPPIIALITSNLFKNSEELLDEGFDDYIIKPIEHKELYMLVKKYLANSSKEGL